MKKILMTLIACLMVTASCFAESIFPGNWELLTDEGKGSFYYCDQYTNPVLNSPSKIKSIVKLATQNDEAVIYFLCEFDYGEQTVTTLDVKAYDKGVLNPKIRIQQSKTKKVTSDDGTAFFKAYVKAKSKLAAGGKTVKIEDLGFNWIKSTADTGYYYDEKTLRVNAAKRTVSVDACVWQPAKNMYTVLGGWTFDYNKMVSYPAWYKEVRISDGVTIKKVDGGKFGKAPFNLDNDNKVYEDFLYKFVK